SWPTPTSPSSCAPTCATGRWRWACSSTASARTRPTPSCSPSPPATRSSGWPSASPALAPDLVRGRELGQLAQPLGGPLVGRGVGDHPGAQALAQPQVGVVQLQQAHLGVQPPLGPVLRCRHLVPLPQLRELR